jgi:hypothetical protein
LCPEQNKSTRKKIFFPEIHPPDPYVKSIADSPEEWTTQAHAHPYEQALIARLGAGRGEPSFV